MLTLTKRAQWSHQHQHQPSFALASLTQTRRGKQDRYLLVTYGERYSAVKVMPLSPSPHFSPPPQLCAASQFRSWQCHQELPAHHLIPPRASAHPSSQIGWSNNPAAVLHEIKSLRATDLTQPSQALQTALELLNLYRLPSKLDFDNYGRGWTPWSAQLASVISISDGGRDDVGIIPALSVFSLSSGHALTFSLAHIHSQAAKSVDIRPAHDLCKSAFHWDQRIFSITLKIPGHRGPYPPPSTWPPTHRCSSPRATLTKCTLQTGQPGGILSSFSDETGGQALHANSTKALQQALEAISPKLNNGGLLVSFEPIPRKDAGGESAERGVSGGCGICAPPKPLCLFVPCLPLSLPCTPLAEGDDEAQASAQAAAARRQLPVSRRTTLFRPAGQLRGNWVCACAAGVGVLCPARLAAHQPCRTPTVSALVLLLCSRSPRASGQTRWRFCRPAPATPPSTSAKKRCVCGARNTTHPSVSWFSPLPCPVAGCGCTDGPAGGRGRAF